MESRWQGMKGGREGGREEGSNCQKERGKLSTFSFLGQEVINLRHSSVVGTDDKAMVVHVQYEVLAL